MEFTIHTKIEKKKKKGIKLPRRKGVRNTTHHEKITLFMCHFAIY